MTDIPKFSTEIGTIEDKHYKRQGVEINLISGRLSSIGPILHLCLNAKTLPLPETLPNGFDKDFVKNISEQAWNYVAEGAAMTTAGFNERETLLEYGKDSLKLNVSLAQKGRGGGEPEPVTMPETR